MRGLLVAASLALASSEYLHWRASSQGLPAPAPARAGDGPDVVLVLGYRSAARGPSAMQRWRTDIAVRSAGAHARLVFSGSGRRARGRTEAEVMSSDAQRRHGFALERIALETSARSTWENVALSAPLLAGARSVTIASSPIHAARARRHLSELHPDLGARLVQAQDYLLLERPLLKLATVAYNLHPRRASGLLPRCCRHSADE